MRRNYKLERLQNGESFVTSEKGNSMVPLIKSGQEHMLEPCSWEDAEVGDIVYCKVRGNWYTHLVTAKNDKRGCQISNNSGYVNGWTKAVYGVVTEVIGGKYKRRKKDENFVLELVEGWEFEDYIKQLNPTWTEDMIENYLDYLLPTKSVTDEQFLEIIKFEYERNKYEIKPKDDNRS